MKTKYIFLSVCIVLLHYSMGAQSLDGQVFIIENISNKTVLDVDGCANVGSNGCVVHLGQKNGHINQHWQLIASGDGDKMYYITNQDSSFEKANYLEVSPLDVSKNGGKIHLWSFNGGSKSTYGANQVWVIDQNPDGSYSIASAHTKSRGAYVIEATNRKSDKNISKVQSWFNRGHNNQMWNLIPID